MKHYDAHMIISAIKERHGKVSCIPSNMENYIYFLGGGVTFKDSLGLTQQSLDKLVKNLHEGQFNETRNYWEMREKNSNQPSNDDDDDDDAFPSSVDTNLTDSYIV